MTLQKTRFDFGVRSPLCGEHDLHAKEHEHRKDDGDDALRFPPEKRGNSRLACVGTPALPPCRTGRICFGGSDVRPLGIAAWAEIRKNELSCIYQELRLFPELTARENVALKNSLTRLKEAKEIDAWFERLGIADKRDVPVGRMSFGQQQRVAAVRALVQPFDFLLADEPVSHLDDANAAVLADIMAEEAARRGAGLIVTSVGRQLPLKYDRVLHL